MLNKKKIVQDVEEYRKPDVTTRVTSGGSCLRSIKLSYLFLMSCVHILHFRWLC